MRRRLNMGCAAGWIWMFLVTSLSAQVFVRDLRLQRHQPWKGTVDIFYRVECLDRGEGETPPDIRISLTGYDQDLDREIQLRSITGDGAEGPVRPGGPYKITWDVKKDYPTFHSSAFSVKIKAVKQPSAGTYLVIDLSGGAEAKAYSYRYSENGPDITGDACRTTELWLRRIPAGTFTMGSPTDELGRDADETQHQVKLTKPFYVGVFEVTQMQWNLVMGGNPSSHEGADRPVEKVSYDDIRGTGSTAGAGWPQYGHKVDAVSFMGKLQAKTGLVLDLPTEAQWEYACRAGTTTALNSGENLTEVDQCPKMTQVGRYDYNRNDGRGKYGEHARVGSYQPNKWELYDMHGNVYEWCLDWYGNLETGTVPDDPEGALGGSDRVLRGGCWDDSAGDCRSAHRYSISPSFKDVLYGFRLACLSAAPPVSPEPAPEPKPGQPTGRYLIINLEGGPDAQSYTYRESETGPDIAGDACRTTELWLRRIPAGTFTMGSPADELGRTEYEIQHRVTLTKPFYIGVFEVTQRQWELVMGDNPSESQGYDRPVERVSYDSIRGSLAQLGRSWPEDGHKVDSASFMGRLQAKTGVIFDLPTEAQWEYACRAGTSAALNSGKNLTVVGDVYCPHMGEVGRYYQNMHDGRGKYIYHCRVGSYLPNSWGLFDMHGNVDEWCLDESEPYENGPVVDPVGEKGSSLRILRGGSWACGFPEWCRSAYRAHNDPHIRQTYIGFRAAVHLPAEEIRK